MEGEAKLRWSKEWSHSPGIIIWERTWSTGMCAKRVLISRGMLHCCTNFQRYIEGHEATTHKSADLGSLIKQTYNAVIKGSRSDGSRAQALQGSFETRKQNQRELHPCSDQKMIMPRQMRLRPKAGWQEHGPCLAGVSKVERNKVYQQDRYAVVTDATNDSTKVEISLFLIKTSKTRGERLILSPANWMTTRPMRLQLAGG